MDDLIARIRAAIDEDERLAKAASIGPWHGSEAGPPKYHDPIVYDAKHSTVADRAGWGDLDGDDMRHMIRHDPTRVLRQVAAHRKLLDAHHPVKHDYGDRACDGCGVTGDLDEPRYDIDECPVLLALAEAYGIQP